MKWSRAEREGLALVTSSSSITGYKGVTFCPKRQSSKKYVPRLLLDVGERDDARLLASGTRYEFRRSASRMHVWSRATLHRC